LRDQEHGDDAQAWQDKKISIAQNDRLNWYRWRIPVE